MAIANRACVVWAVDSLEKLSRDAPPGDRDCIAVESCRNEYASAQLAVRALRRISALRISPPVLVHESGADGVEVTARFVGYVPLKENTTNTPTDELTCIAPALCPDPLLVDEALAVDEASTQPVWVTLFVPANAPAGRWRGTVAVNADGDHAEVPIELIVHPISLPNERNLWVTNWMDRRNLARFHATDLYTPRFWQIVENYARNMAAHRQNVTKVSLRMIDIRQKADARLVFDYANFDRWVETFTRAGCMELIEGDALGGWGDGKFESPWLDWEKFVACSEDGSEVALDPEAAITALLGDLCKHLKERRWFERFILHIVDEPAPHSEDDYRRKVSLVRSAAPGVRLIEAMSCMDARGYLDIWVPCLDHLHANLDHYLRLREQSGFEMWFYTCCNPTGRYPNRLLDFSLLKTRILHWINWRYKLSGYLHWGLNYWADDPFQSDRLYDDVPAGDCWIIYPGPDGPLDSLRWEHMREGIQDYELLRLLDRRGKESGRLSGEADRICTSLVPDPVSYGRDWRELRAARRNVVDAILSLPSGGS